MNPLRRLQALSCLPDEVAWWLGRHYLFVIILPQLKLMYEMGVFDYNRKAGHFEISWNGKLIYHGSRMTVLRFKDARVEDKKIGDKWELKVLSKHTVSISQEFKRGQLSYRKIMCDGVIVRRLSYSNKWLYCRKKYKLTCNDASELETLLFAFGFCINEETKFNTM